MARRRMASASHKRFLPPTTEKEASFHRIRLNPRFSNLIMYRRNPLNSKDADGASRNL
jgi:hypothetical protein